LAVAYHATPLPTPPGRVSISFPDGSRADFTIHASGYRRPDKTAFAAVIKDAGDDPDVTNGAEIVAEAIITRKYLPSALVIKGGKGVGTVTKPGLAIAVGEPAINPVPRKMIADAISEAFSGTPFRSSDLAVEITILVTNGELLAKKTLNEDSALSAACPSSVQPGLCALFHPRHGPRLSLHPWMSPRPWDKPK